MCPAILEVREGAAHRLGWRSMRLGAVWPGPVCLLAVFGIEFLVAQTVKHPPAMQDTRVRSLGWENSLEKEMAAHSSILAWEIHGQRSLVGYSSRGCKRVGHDLATKKQQKTPKRYLI